MHPLEYLALEQLQEEAREAVATHCEREGAQRRALRRLLESYEDLRAKGGREIASAAEAFLARPVEEARIILGD